MELIQNILVTALLGIWACLSIGFFVWLVQGISNDHKREKREKEQASRDLCHPYSVGRNAYENT